MKKKIFVISGTFDGRLLIEWLLEKGYPITASVATELGASYLKSYSGLFVHTGRMNQEDLVSFLKENNFDLVIDASHPYAEEISRNGMAAAEFIGIPYARLERKKIAFTGNWKLVSSYEEAVSVLNQTQGSILLTTGTNRLSEFQKVKQYQQRIFVRTLNQEEAREKCLKLGFQKEKILCMDGPFTAEENLRQIKQHQICVLVTKDSGKTGGTEEKVKAAEEAGILLLVIGRPKINYKNKFQSLEKLCVWIEEENW